MTDCQRGAGGCMALGPPNAGWGAAAQHRSQRPSPHPTRAARRWRARGRLRRTSPSPTPANAALRPCRHPSDTVPATRPFAAGAAPSGDGLAQPAPAERLVCPCEGGGPATAQGVSILLLVVGCVRMRMWCSGGGSASARPRARVLPRGSCTAPARPLGRHPPDRYACPPASDTPQLRTT